MQFLNPLSLCSSVVDKSPPISSLEYQGYSIKSFFFFVSLFPPFSSPSILGYTDSCTGATIQYFSDTTCTTLAHERTVDDFDTAQGCNAYDGDNVMSMGEYTVTVPLYYWKLHCTAQPTKPIQVSSATVE